MEFKNFFESIILDVDNSVVNQVDLIKKLDATIIPLQQESEKYRFYCKHEEMIALRNIILKKTVTSKPKLILYGSGDYHNLAYLGLSLIKEDVTVIHFDNHTDWWKFPFHNYHFFGDWVVWALRMKNVKKVIQFGVDGDLTLKPNLPPVGTFTHRLDLLLNGKIEMYPYAMEYSTFWGRIKGKTKCVTFKPSFLKTKAHWKNLSNPENEEEILKNLISSIETESVYFSIDKDVFDEKVNFAAYPKLQGTMPLEMVTNFISKIAQNKKVVGIDICGDGSTMIGGKSLIKKFMINQKEKTLKPNSFKSKENIILNQNANLSIIAAFEKGFKTTLQ
jgi:hypothetical protein